MRARALKMALDKDEKALLNRIHVHVTMLRKERDKYACKTYTCIFFETFLRFFQRDISKFAYDFIEDKKAVIMTVSVVLDKSMCKKWGCQH